VGDELQGRKVPEVHGRRPLPQAGLDEIDRQRPAEIEERQDEEDDPGAEDGAARVPDVLPHVAVAGERAGRTMLAVVLGHQKTFSITYVVSVDSPTSASIRSK